MRVESSATPPNMRPLKVSRHPSESPQNNLKEEQFDKATQEAFVGKRIVILGDLIHCSCMNYNVYLLSVWNKKKYQHSRFHWFDAPSRNLRILQPTSELPRGAMSVHTAEAY